MHALRGTRRLVAGVALAAFALGLAPATALAKPWPSAKKDEFKLMAGSLVLFLTNNVGCGVSTRGEVCVDPTGSGTFPGGFWPRGTTNGYVFNSGLQIAGIIQGTKGPDNPWGGDTTGAFFFDPKGTTRQGDEVTQAIESTDATDAANWPDYARVPQGDAGEDLFDPLLRGQVAASQGDLHMITWEGNPAFLSGRSHPLGILAEYRLMGWNYPSGNEDLIYLIITFYNITTTHEADYAQHRASIRPILLQKAADFQALNNAKFGITLPSGGYTIGPMFAAFAADMDVGSAGINYASVNLPFALGYAYQRNFFTAPGWIFDPSIFGKPFFAGVGFVGVKYLKSPTGPGKIQLYSNNVNGGSNFSDPGNTTQLYRYLSGGVVAGLDGNGCTYPGNPLETHICFIKHSPAVDIRFFQSSTPLTLAPGESGSIVVAYIFAAPVAIPGFVAASGTDVDPGDPGWTNHPDSMLAHNGVPRVDSLTGFLQYLGTYQHDENNVEHVPTQDEFKVVPKSLLGKALTAQTVFDNHFLLPFAPDRPDFFLVPGDKSVTILWKPSATETTGDAYFAVAGSANTNGLPNALYDPNYRQFDVEGYRIYRGRTSAPNTLHLLAQFDYAGTVFKDYGGNVQQPLCAPELAVTSGCPVAMTKITPGVTSTKHADYDISGDLIQVKYGDRGLLATGDVQVFHADTAITGENSGKPALSNTGVPFVFIDKAGAAGCAICGVSNGVTYFYTVTAFDVNSVNSAPSSLESGPVTKSVVVGAPASNFTTSGNVTVTGPYGRGTLLTDNVVPTIDPATGIFSKKQPPTNGASVSLGSFVTQVLKAGTVSIQLDSITYVSVADGGNNVSTQWLSSGSTVISIPISINTAGYTNGATMTASFPALNSDATLSAVYGGGGGYSIPGAISVQTPPGYTTGTKGRGCINGNTATTPFTTSPNSRQCVYNGPRWFIGDQETKPNPISDTPDLFDGFGAAVTNSNAGELAGVTRIWHPLEYFNTASTWRRMSGAMSGFISDADYRVYWGNAGHVDSVIDLTHNTVVPFSPNIEASWGILNQSAVASPYGFDARPVLGFLEIDCVAPFKTDATIQGGAACPGGATAALSQTAVPGPIVICSSASFGCTKTAAPQAGQGFLFYIKGEVFMMELAGGVPAAGTAWTMRDYTGAVINGNGNAGNWGDYVFHPDALRPFTAPGVAFQFAVNTVNQLNTADASSLDKVHTVPDPYYVTSAYDRTSTSKIIKFVNLPTDATIRIYTTSGVLVRVLHNTTTSYSGTVDWDVRNRSNQFVASGVYFYTVEANGFSRTYRMTIVNYASNIQ